MPGASKRELTKPEELNFLINWFSEFSEMQRCDFFKIILKKYASSNVDADLVTSAIKMMQVNDRPPTIFHCRMKLFDDWFTNWSDEEKGDLLVRLKNLDAAFMNAFQNTLDGVSPLEEDTFRQPILPILDTVVPPRPVSESDSNACSVTKTVNGNGTNGCSQETASPSPTEEKEIVPDSDVPVNGQNGTTNGTGEEKISVEVEVEG